MILPKTRDPRLVTDSPRWDPHRRGSPSACPVGGDVRRARPRPLRVGAADDPRPREAIEHARAWVRGEVAMMQARAAGGHAMGAARDLRGAPLGSRIRRWSGRRRGARRRARSRRGRLCDQGRSRCRAGRRDRVRRADASASGSATSSRTRFASSSSTTSGCGTTSAGRCSRSDPARRPHSRVRRESFIARVMAQASATGPMCRSLPGLATDWMVGSGRPGRPATSCRLPGRSSGEHRTWLPVDP